jgi:hypothetical protein
MLVGSPETKIFSYKHNSLPIYIFQFDNDSAVGIICLGILQYYLSSEHRKGNPVRGG